MEHAWRWAKVRRGTPTLWNDSNIGGPELLVQKKVELEKWKAYERRQKIDTRDDDRRDVRLVQARKTQDNVVH